MSTTRIVDFKNVDTNGKSKRVDLSAVVNGILVLYMCDSGSDVNFIPYSLVDPKTILPVTGKSYAANGTGIKIIGPCKVNTQFVNQVHVEFDFLVFKIVACPMFGTKWLKKNTSSCDFASGIINIQGFKFKLEEENDLPKYCGKIMANEDVSVPPHSRKTVPGLVFISSARVVNVPDWLTKHRMIRP